MAKTRNGPPKDPPTPTRVIPAEARGLLQEAIKDGLTIIANRLGDEDSDPLKRHEDYPELETFDSGVPHFSNSLSPPIDYTSAFDKPQRSFRAALLGKPEQPYERPEKIPSWRAFIELAEKDPTLRKYFDFEDSRMLPGHEQSWANHCRFVVGFLLQKLCARHMHIAGSALSEAAFDKLCSEWEHAVLAPRLQIQILVPIVFLGFDFDRFEFSATMRIERLSRELQLARNTQRAYTIQSHECVVGGATHALVLDGWFVPNETENKRSNILYDARAFGAALERVDQVLAALRSATGYSFGYSQLIARPVGWADRWEADLEPLYASSVRKYPDHFEDFGWLKPFPKATDLECTVAKLILQAFDGPHGGQLKFAGRRLNAAFLRSTEEDAIVDVTSGLESLLAPEKAPEIAYRLRMRLGTLARVWPPPELSALQVYHAIGKLYDFRSAVVHGSKADKKRLISLPGAEVPIPAIVLGLQLLRYAIEILSAHPEFLDQTKLDQFIVMHGDSPSANGEQTPPPE